MNRAFTLVELAIVIVIIGLLVGGVLQGQELIKQAKYRSTMKDIEGYKGSIATFFSKYNCLPGDCSTGFRFFGATCGIDAVVSSTSRNGCNGNGNKVLSTPEGQLFWKHLTQAKIIKGSFTSDYVDVVATNENLPPSPMGNNVGISVFFSQGNVSATSCGYQYCEGDANVRGGMLGKNVFNLGATDGNEDFSRGSFITPGDAYEFDVKFDDGIFYSGFISGFNGIMPTGSAGNCGVAATQAYTLTPVARNLATCRMIFDTGF